MSATLEAPVHTTVIGVFNERTHAAEAVGDLRRAGFSDDQIGFLGPDPVVKKSDSSDTNVEEGAGIGTAVGAAVGGATGLAVAAGLLTPIGPAIAGGAIVAWLASVGAGAAAGAAVGALVGLGVPEDEAQWYEAELKAGRSLVLVHKSDERSEDARHILRRHGAHIQEPSNIGTYGTGLPATPF